MNSNTKNKPQIADPFDSARKAVADIREQLAAGTYEFREWLPVVSPTLTWNWKHQLYLYKQLDRITSREIDRLQIAMPPRHTKSETVTVRYAAWRLEQDPSMRIIIGAYNQKLANKFSRKIRRLLTGRVAFSEDCNAVEEWETAAGGGIRAVGVGGGVTGFGADLIIIDDPVKSRKQAESETYRENIKDWFNDDLYTRLEPGGQIALIQCMTGDTPVLMLDGNEKPLKNIQVGDIVATYDKGHLTTSKVLNWKNQGSDFIYAIRMKSGIIVKANEKHPFLVWRGDKTEWIRLKNLKPGDEIVRAMRKRERIEERRARLTDAKKAQNAKDIVIPTTIKPDGQADIVRRRSIRHQDAQRICATDTASALMNTRQCSKSRAENALSAASLQPRKTPALIGTENSALTTATTPAKSEGYCATTATLQSVTAKPNKSYSKPLNTYELTLDSIIEITPAGREDVFDIQVERTENFIANGLVSHNTRWHDDDLAGYLQKQALEEDGEKWEVVSLPALAEENDPLERATGEALCPERYDRAALLRIKKKLTGYGFDALYQQRPTPREGALFKLDWFPEERRIRNAPSGLRWVRGYDLAVSQKTSADYFASFAVAFDADGNMYIRDGFRKRLEYPDQKKKIIEWMVADGRKTRHAITKALHGLAIVQELRREKKVRGVAFRAVEEKGDKYSRALPWADLAADGKVFLVRGRWIADFLSELVMFPQGSHDDQIDAVPVPVEMHTKKSGKVFAD